MNPMEGELYGIEVQKVNAEKKEAEVQQGIALAKTAKLMVASRNFWVFVSIFALTTLNSIFWYNHGYNDCRRKEKDVQPVAVSSLIQKDQDGTTK